MVPHARDITVAATTDATRAVLSLFSAIAVSLRGERVMVLVVLSLRHCKGRYEAAQRDRDRPRRTKLGV